MKLTLTTIFMALALASSAFGVNCGTLAALTPTCSITSGNTTFDLSNFSFIAVAGTNGGNSYQAGDVTINLTAAGSGAASLTVSKTPNSPTAGTSFFVNANQTAGFKFSYDLSIAPALPGTVAFIDPVSVAVTQSNAANGQVVAQTVLPGAPTCVVFTTSVTDTCTLPVGLGTILSTGEILSLNGNSGNAAFLNHSTTFQTSFTADPGPSGVPEPATYATFAVGLAAIAFVRRRS